MAKNGIIDEIADIAAIERQKAAIIKALEAIKDELGKLSVSAVDAYAAFKKIPNHEFAALNKAYREAREEADRLADAISRQAVQEKALESVTARLATAQAEQAAATAKTREAMADAGVKAAQAAAATEKFTGAVKSYTSASDGGNVSVKKAMDLLDKYGVSLDSVTRKYYEYKAEHKAAQEKLKELEKEYDGTTSKSKEYMDQLIKLRTEEGKLSKQLDETKTNMNQLQKAAIQADDSDKQRRLTLGQLKELYRVLRQERKLEDDGRELEESIQALDANVKHAAETIGNHQDSVGHYQRSVEGLQGKLAEAAAEIQRVGATLAAGNAAYEASKQKVDELGATMAKMAAEGKTNTRQYADMQRAMNEANVALERQRVANEETAKAHGELQKNIAETNAQIALFAGKIAEATKDVSPMKTKLKELKQEAQELLMAMNDGTATDDMVKRFHEVTAEAAKLHDTIGDVSSRVARMASDTSGLDAVTQAIKGCVSAFQVFKGTMSLLGLESEAFEQVMIKLAAAQSIVNGLTEIGNALNRDSALRAKINTLATSQNVAVKWLAVAAQKALNAAMKAAPYMLAIAAIAALVAIIYKFAKSNSEAAQRQKALNDLQKESAEIAKNEAKSLSDLTTTINLYAAGSRERNAAIRQINEQYGDYLPNLLSEKSSVEEITAAYERLTEVMQQQAVVKAAQGEMEKYAKERIALAAKEAVEQIKVDEAVKKREEYEEDASLSMQTRMARRLNLDAQVAAAEDDLRSVQKENAKEYEAIAKKEVVVIENAKIAVGQLVNLQLRSADATKEQEAAQNELQKLTRQLEDVQLSAWKSEEKRQRRALALAKSRAVEDFNAQKQALGKTEDERTKNAAKIARIDELIAATGVKYDQDAAAMEQKFRHEAAKAAISTRLLMAKEGSAEELQARKDMVDEELYRELLNLSENYAAQEEVRAKAAKAKEALDRAAAKRARDMALEEVGIRLEYAQEGSDNELKLTVEKLELERDAALAEAEQTGADVDAIRQKWAKLTADAVSKWTKAGMDRRTREESEALELSERQELVALTQRYADGLVTQEEYERERQAIANRYAKDGLRLQIGNLKEQVDNSKLTDEQRREAMQELADFEMQLNEQVADEKAKGREQELANEKKAAEQLKELAKEVADFALQLVNQQYEARIEALEAQKEALQKSYDEEIANIEAAGYSDEEAEARKRSAAAQTKAAQDKIDEQVKEEKRKQAIANKAAAIAQAAISTALAILNIWATVPKVDFGVSTGVLTGIAAAIGAVQVAAIAAQPIPKYAHGRTGGREEWAIVGDAGVREVIAPAHGKPYLTPGKPTLTRLGAGDDVFPSFQDYVRWSFPHLVPDIVKNGGTLPETRVDVDLSELLQEQRRQTEELKEAIKGQSELQISSTRRGVYMAVKSTSGAVRSVNWDYNKR